MYQTDRQTNIRAGTFKHDKIGYRVRNAGGTVDVACETGLKRAGSACSGLV